AEDGIRDFHVTGVQTCALPIYLDFEEPTVAYVDETLIDVLIYRTTQNDGQGFVGIFSEFNPDIAIITEGGSNNTNSIQRFVDERSEERRVGKECRRGETE